MRPHLIHVMPGFAPGGAQVRVAAIINHFGDRYRHTILALNGDTSARSLLDGSAEVAFPACPKARNPLVMIRRLGAVFRTMRPQLVLTYNWGSIDAVLAAGLLGIAPVIHTEDGFAADEAIAQKPRRVRFRNLALRFAHTVVAPSAVLIDIMLRQWKLPAGKVRHIPNGIDVSRFRATAPAAGRNEFVVGTVGRLQAEKRQDVLLRAAAALAKTVPLRVAIAGDGPDRAGLESLAASLEISGRVDFLGYRSDLWNIYPMLDVFALTSSTEQMPYSVLEAMASGLPVVSTDVGDIRRMVSPENGPFVVQTEAELVSALRTLAGDADLRRAIGVANQARCTEVYSIDRMFREYEQLYDGAIGGAGYNV